MRNRSDQFDFHYFVMFKSAFEHDVVFPVSHPSTLRYVTEIKASQHNSHLTLISLMIL